MNHNSNLDATSDDELETQTRYRLMEALVRSERRARVRVESLNEIVFETDGDGIITFANGSWERLLGHVESPVGTNFSAHVSDADIEATKTLFRDGGGATTLMVQAEPGRQCPMQLSITRVDEETYVGTLFDLSERILAEARVEALNFELEKRINERTLQLEREVEQRRQIEAELHLAQKLEAVGRLAAGLAHEINTPLQYLGNNLEFVDYAFGQLRGLVTQYRALIEHGGRKLEGSRAEEEFDYAFIRDELPVALERSLAGAQRVREIVRSMQDFNHPDGGHPEEVRLRSVVETAAKMVGNQREFDCNLRLEVGEDLTVPGFSSALKQVILNLLVNAAQASSDAAGAEVRVSGRREGAFVRLQVEDDGVGVAPEHLERIFDPFFTTKEVGQGTGQGLAIARRIVVDQHRGRLWCEPKPGGGTVFHVELPLEEVAGETTVRLAAVGEGE